AAVYWASPTNRTEQGAPWFRVDEVLKGPPLAEFHPTLTFPEDQRSGCLGTWPHDKPVLFFVINGRSCVHECGPVVHNMDAIVEPRVGELPAAERELRSREPATRRREFAR